MLLVVFLQSIPFLGHLSEVNPKYVPREWMLAEAYTQAGRAWAWLNGAELCLTMAVPWVERAVF